MSWDIKLRLLMEVKMNDQVKFKDYDDFRKFILRSREKKDKRYEKMK